MSGLKQVLACLQTMTVGGNQRARQYFKQNGWSELGTDKIEQKVGCKGGILFQQWWSGDALLRVQIVNKR